MTWEDELFKGHTLGKVLQKEQKSIRIENNLSIFETVNLYKRLELEGQGRGASELWKYVLYSAVVLEMFHLSQFVYS